MSFFTDILNKREENNIRLEHEADESLFGDKRGIRIEEEIEDAQSAVLFILEHLNIETERLYGFLTLQGLLDTLLDPLGMLYEDSDDLIAECKTRSKYILAFKENGKAVALLPTMAGYRYYCPSDGTAGFATKRFLKRLQKDCYVFSRPLIEKESIIGTFVSNVMRALTVYDVKLVGFDSLHIASPEVESLVHVELLQQDVVILEDVNLDQIKDGRYFLVALPLKMEGLDGSPTRAVLMLED